MPDTALEIAQNVAADVGFGLGGSLFNTTNGNANRCRVLMNLAGRNMGRMRNTWGGGWSFLTREFVFDTEPNVEEYRLPGDFLGLIDGTLWDRDTYRRARGTLTPQQWQQLRSGVTQTVSTVPYFRLVAATAMPGQHALRFDPVPSSRDSLALEYVANSWAVSTDGARQDSFLANTDVPLYDSELLQMDLLWRFKSNRGLSYATELAEYEAELGRRFGDDAGARAVVLGNNRSGYGSGFNIPETGFGGL